MELKIVALSRWLSRFSEESVAVVHLKTHEGQRFSFTVFENKMRAEEESEKPALAQEIIMKDAGWVLQPWSPRKPESWRMSRIGYFKNPGVSVFQSFLTPQQFPTRSPAIAQVWRLKAPFPPIEAFRVGTLGRNVSWKKTSEAFVETVLNFKF